MLSFGSQFGQSPSGRRKRRKRPVSPSGSWVGMNDGEAMELNAASARNICREKCTPHANRRSWPECGGEFRRFGTTSPIAGVRPIELQSLAPFARQAELLRLRKSSSSRSALATRRSRYPRPGSTRVCAGHEYADHLPLHRQSEIYAWQGASTSTTRPLDDRRLGSELPANY